METSPIVRIAYPQSLVGGKPTQDGKSNQYGCTILIDKKDAQQMAWLKKLIAECQGVLETGWPDPAKRPRIPLYGHDKSPIKDADKNCKVTTGVPYAESNPEFAGHYIIPANTYGDQPPVVGSNMQQIMTPGTIKGGDWCRVNVNPYARKRPDNPGISIGLNGVQFIRPGEERFGGGAPSADQMFDAIDAPELGAGNDPFGDAPGDDLDPLG